MKIDVLDHGFVRLVESWGGGDHVNTTADIPCSDWEDRECGIIEAARQSTQGSFRSWEKDEKLLKYLFENKHATPFEFAGMVIEVKAPLFVFREWHRHRTQCLAGDTMIACLSPRGTVYQRTIKHIYESKHGVEVDAQEDALVMTGNGTTKQGKPATRKRRRKVKGRSRVLPNCSSRMLRTINEETGLAEGLPMKEVWQSGVKPIFLIETENGKKCKASKDHRFLTKDGWMEAIT